MIDITLKIGTSDFSHLLSTYNVTHETEYQTLMTALDGTEYGSARYRPVLSFSLIPLTDSQCEDLYNAIHSVSASVTYTDPLRNTDVTADMRLTTSLQAIFGLKSIDGNRYYKGSTITFRQRTVI